MQQCRRVGGLLDLFAEQRHASLDGCDSHSGRPHSAVVLQQQRNLGQTVTRQGVMKRRTQHDSHPEKKPQQGMTLIEVLIAMLVMTVGMGGLLALFMTAATSTNRNSKDTSATLLAQMVLQQISAQHPDSTATINLTDCAGNAWTVATAGGASPAGAGAAVDQNSASLSYGSIDQTQQYAAVSANYAMQYTDCDTNGHQTVYDVRWNVMTITANSTRLITVTARQNNVTSNQLGNARFAIPVTLRGIGAP